LYHERARRKEEEGGRRKKECGRQTMEDETLGTGIIPGVRLLT